MNGPWFFSDPSPGRYVYPRLRVVDADQLIAERAELPVAELVGLSATGHDRAIFRTSGTRVPEYHLVSVRARVRLELGEPGHRFGCPVPRGQAAEFDRALGAVLHAELDIVPADAAVDDVWSFLTLVLLPEIGPWRFGARHRERLLGTPRNVLRRTWWRAHVLGPDLGGASERSPCLGEDELVQIFERPTLARNRRVAREIVGVVHDATPTLTVARSQFVRDLTLRLLRITPLVNLDALTPEQLSELIGQLAAEARAALENPVGPVRRPRAHRQR